MGSDGFFVFAPNLMGRTQVPQSLDRLNLFYICLDQPQYYHRIENNIINALSKRVYVNDTIEIPRKGDIFLDRENTVEQIVTRHPKKVFRKSFGSIAQSVVLSAIILQSIVLDEG